MSIASTDRSSPAFAIGGVADQFACICCGQETALRHFQMPRGICPEHCPDHNYEYDPYERQHVCTECFQFAPADWYDVD